MTSIRVLAAKGQASAVFAIIRLAAIHRGETKLAGLVEPEVSQAEWDSIKEGERRYQTNEAGQAQRENL